MKKFAPVLAFALCACAPTSQLQLSAGRIGCPTSEIKVSDTDSTRHTKTWSATCRGQTYFCSSTDDFLEVMCKPELKAIAVAPAPPAPVAAPAPSTTTADAAPAAAPAATTTPAVPDAGAPPPAADAPGAVPAAAADSKPAGK